MKIIKKENGEALRLALEGRPDTNTAPELEAVLKGSLEGIKELTIDMTALEYLSSAGLRVLLGAQKSMNKQGSMKVANANEMILEVFEITGFSEILTLE